MSTKTELQYGITPGTLTWIQGFRAQLGDDNKWTGSESFKCLKSDLIKLLPKKGAPCTYPGFGFMTVSGIEVENLPGSYDQVNVQFSGTGKEGDFTFDDDDEQQQDPEYNKYNYQLSINVTNEPIETHPKFREIPLNEKEIIYNIINGNLKRSKKTDEPYKFYDAQTTDQKGTAYTLEDESAQKLADYILNGVTTYQAARQIWRCSFNAADRPPANILNSVGKITSAKGAPALGDGRNWLFVGVDASSSNGLWSIAYEWHMSDTGGWDEYPYGND